MSQVPSVPYSCQHASTGRMPSTPKARRAGGTTYTAHMKKTVFWGVLLMVVAGSLLPVDYLPPPVFSIWDKLQHATAFAALYLLGLQAYRSKSLQVILGLLLLGAAIEVAQAATGWRYGEWLDWLADAIGIGAAVGLSVAWPRLRFREG